LRLEHRRETLAHDRMVVGDGDSDAHASAEATAAPA
jgi:hypothetical protein